MPNILFSMIITPIIQVLEFFFTFFYEITENARNPFSDFPLKVEDKQPLIKIQVAKAQSTRIRKNSQFPVQKDEWFTVHDNIFINENRAPYME